MERVYGFSPCRGRRFDGRAANGASLLVWKVASILVASEAIGLAQQADPTQFFESRVRPILANNCFGCHTTSKLGGLQVDSKEGLLKGGKRGAAIAPGDPEASLLIRAVTQADPEIKMPMGGKLKDQEIADLKSWIAMGAPWPESAAPANPAGAKKGFVLTPQQRTFWSFQPLSKPAPPAVKDRSWAKSPIDRFVLAKLEEQGLKPVKPADKRTLIRRASFDLTGLPPTIAEIDAFLADSSPEAFAKVVDRLLASPHYGERWGRHWLDVARYTDAELRVRKDYTEAYRYRDWVIDAFNQDMPHDRFVKAQIAGDLLSESKDPKLLPALGFISLGIWVYQGDIPYKESRGNELDDRVDVLTRGFLGLTAACARCHDHKYDPISQKDYYALAGIFASSDYHQYFLAPDEAVAKYKESQQKIRDKGAEAQKLLADEGKRLEEQMLARTSEYMVAAWKLSRDSKLKPAELAAEAHLEPVSLERWVRYLAEKEREHRYLRDWDAMIARGGGQAEAQALADEFQKTALAIMAEKKALDAENVTARRRSRREANVAKTFKPDGAFHFDTCSYCEATLKTLARDKYYLVADLVQRETGLTQLIKKPAGVFEYKGQELLRFLSTEQKAKYDQIQAELKDLRKSAPPESPYIMSMTDSPTPANLKVNIRGNVYNLGEEAPRGFPAILGNTEGEPLPFTKGSGRLELADAVVNHPLTPRVIVNRIWAEHFGRGIVATPSNFGQTGGRPTHPELLDYLAGRLIDNRWSIKALHREIMLSSAYQLSNEASEAAEAIDAENRFHWRANSVRIDAEALRDSLLFVAGNLDLKVGGPPRALSLENKRRAIYGKVSRETSDPSMTWFDFPDPNLTSEQRTVTSVPLQGLFFLNSDFVLQQADALAKRVAFEGGGDDVARIRYAYQLVYGRVATEAEIRVGLEFLKGASKWPRYAQALLSSGEFYFLD